MHIKVFLYSWVLGVVFSQSLNYPPTLSRHSGTDQSSRRNLYVPLVIRDTKDLYKQYVTTPVQNDYQDNENDEIFFRHTAPVFVKVPQNQDIAPQENGYRVVSQNKDIARQDNYRFRPVSQSPIPVLVKQNYPYQASVDADSTIAPPINYHAFSTTTPSEPIPVPVIFDEASTVKPSRPLIGSDYKGDSIPESSTYQETPIPVKVPPYFQYQSSISNHLLPFQEGLRQSEIPFKSQENNASLEADAHPVVVQTSQISAPPGSVDADAIAYITSLIMAHSQEAPQVVLGNNPVTTSTRRSKYPGEIPIRSDIRILPKHNYDYVF